MVLELQSSKDKTNLTVVNTAQIWDTESVKQGMKTALPILVNGASAVNVAMEKLTTLMEASIEDSLGTIKNAVSVYLLISIRRTLTKFMSANGITKSGFPKWYKKI